MDQSTIAAAIRELETRLRVIDAERAQLTQAVDTLQRLTESGMGRPAMPTRSGKAAPPISVRAPRVRAPKTVAIQPDALDGAAAEKLLKALAAAGPLGTGALSKKAGVNRYAAKAALEQLAKKGMVHSTGATAGQKWHLGAATKRQPGPPAKEAP